MKHIKYLLIFVFVATLSISCNNDDDSSESDINNSELIGIWKVTNPEGGNSEEVVLTFNADYSGNYEYASTDEAGTRTVAYSQNFSWSTSGNTITIKSGGETLNWIYSITGNQLTIDDPQNDFDIVYTRQ